jgi:signal transduction histidine kinase
VQDRLDPGIIGELLGLIAHDLRNPLSALHSNLGFLRSVLAPSEHDARDAVDDGIVSCDGLAHIIDNIDLFGQALRGAERGDAIVSDLGGLVAEVVRATHPMAQSHGVDLKVDEAVVERVAVESPRDLLARALSNLIRNSIQHSPSGAGVRVAMRVSPSEVIVSVRDEGTALTGEVRRDAFTAGGQIASKSIPNGRYSRGLGLYCAALAAAAAGATVRGIDVPSGNGFELVVGRMKP